MKTCVNCRHIHQASNSGTWCNSPQRPPEQYAQVHQMVHGGPLRLECLYAENARAGVDLCGSDARWFEPRKTIREWLGAAFSAGDNTGTEQRP